MAFKPPEKSSCEAGDGMAVLGRSVLFSLATLDIAGVGYFCWDNEDSRVTNAAALMLRLMNLQR